MSADDPAAQLNLEALYGEVTRFLAQVPVAEGMGAKLSRLLFGFLQEEVLPQACRAAELGIDPTPLFAVVADVLRQYADALQRPEGAGH
jgi:hypothetical protein